MEAVEIAGIKISKIYHTANTKMEFRHPKYYKELRKRNKSDQSISSNAPEKPAAGERSTGPGLKPQATSSQASSDKHQAPSNKRQAPSRKQQAL